jgi:hypothetical protein
MPVNKELLARARVKTGDTVTVVMSMDTAARTVAIPDNLDAVFRGTKRPRPG